jgi:threonine/homoserine/homoserine lactone efflux protein
MVWAFVPVAIVVTLTPGAATAMIVRNALRGGSRAGVLTIAGNSIGVVAWALLSVLGISALVAASEAAFVALKVTGAVVLVWMGVQSLRRSRAGAAAEATEPQPARPLRDGLITSLANPKLAVFFAALFPQFVPDGASVLWSALLMAAMIVAFDLVWYSALAYLVARARRAFVEGPWLARAERVTGAVLVGLGVRLALERR